MLGTRTLLGIAIAVSAGLLLAATPAAAISIRYSVSDLTDETPGQDLWRYEYQLDAFPFAAGYGFSVAFDPLLSSSLEADPPAPDPAWDVISLQPDPLLPASGLFDAQALSDSPPVAAPFSLTFVWEGPGAPGAQSFVVYDPSFASVESGITVVPEPGAGLLVAFGLGLLSAARPRGQRKRQPGGRA